MSKTDTYTMLKHSIETLCFISEDKVNHWAFNPRTSKADIIELQRLLKDVDFSGCSLQEKAYRILHDCHDGGVCIVCGSRDVGFLGLTHGYRRTCSPKCAANDPERNAKTKKTQLERYGGSHMSNKEWIANRKQQLKDEDKKWPGSFGTQEFKDALKEKYGVDNAGQIPEVIQQIKDTCMDRYGVTNPQQVPEIAKRSVETNRRNHPEGIGAASNDYKRAMHKKYGVTNPFQVPEISKKSIETNRRNHPEGIGAALDAFKKTMLEKYGYENPLSVPEITERRMKTSIERHGGTGWQIPRIHKASMRSLSQLKSFTLPSGKVIDLMGYEPQVLTHLLENGYHEDDFDWDVPIIRFIFNGKNARYTPDFWIPSRNQILEVKSGYTYNNWLDKNLAKEKACKEQGHDFKFLIWDDATKKIID